ncbi:hypothetical protein C0J52_05873 [Blattella germanica]|nr:hypothetical protein C0J52_05873 [Blattella germanica]
MLVSKYTVPDNLGIHWKINLKSLLSLSQHLEFSMACSKGYEVTELNKTHQFQGMCTVHGPDARLGYLARPGTGEHEMKNLYSNLCNLIVCNIHYRPLSHSINIISKKPN